jgi:hypothetical protein
MSTDGFFIDDYFGENFYKKLPLGYHSHFSFGQIFRTQAYYPHENLQLWRPIPDPNEPTKTIASAFQIVAAGQDAFRRTIPLAAPKLETNEEFIVVRAKVRPVLLVVPELPPLGVQAQGYRGKIQRRRCLVAQIFGLADTKTGIAEFSPTFVDRVRKMEFPELMFLAHNTGPLSVDSLLRLDELQSVFTPHLEPTQYSLGDEAIDVLQGQVQYLMSRQGPSRYTELRELLMNG